MGYILIDKAGLFDTIQDQGRTGYQAYGVPRAGAMDMYAYQLGNLLLGNDRNCPSLEMTWFGPTLRFTAPASIVISGANLTPTINGSPLDMWKVISIQKGDVLAFGAAKEGCRAYLAVKGGFTIPATMGSASTYVKGEMGGWLGRALQSGDQIPFGVDDHPIPNISLSHSLRPHHFMHTIIRVILGPQEESFSEQGITTFLSTTYKVTSEMDRMGIRLDGRKIEHAHGADILSDSIPFGGIQVPANGQPIILMADRQTTGGYPKIATVISADLPKVAQLLPNQTIQFQAVPVEEAQQLYRDQEKLFRGLEIYFRCILNSRKRSL